MPVPASGHEPGVVNSTVYAGGRKVADFAIEDTGEWSKRAGHVVWIGLVERGRCTARLFEAIRLSS
jgi:magnesium transporter